MQWIWAAAISSPEVDAAHAAQVGIAFADKDYPARAAFGIVIKVLDEFSDQSRDAWRTATADSTDAVPLLEAAVQKYQVRGDSLSPGVPFAYAELRFSGHFLSSLASVQGRGHTYCEKSTGNASEHNMPEH